MRFSPASVGYARTTKAEKTAANDDTATPASACTDTELKGRAPDVLLVGAAEPVPSAISLGVVPSRKEAPHCDVNASVTLLCCAIEGSSSLRTLYACLTQSEHAMPAGIPDALPVTSCGTVATMLFRLSVPSALSISVSMSVKQSVLLLVVLRHAISRATGYPCCTSEETVPSSLLSKPREPRSLLHPLVKFATMSDSVWFEHGSWAHVPASHELMGCTSEVFEPAVRIGSSPPGFRHSASGEPAIVSSADWHCEEMLIAVATLAPASTKAAVVRRDEEANISDDYA